MILRLLLTLLNPYNNGRLPRRKDFWLRCRIVVFAFCVRRLQRRYRQYAYYDGINLGTVKIIQSCRDEVFEGWLKATGQDIRPHLLTSKAYPKDNKKRSSLKPFYKFFNFKRQLVINESGEELLIDRTSLLIISNKIKGALSISDDTDIIIRTDFRSASRIQEKKSFKNNTKETKDDSGATSVVGNPPPRRPKVSLGKPIIISPSPPVKPPANEAPKIVGGIEIDESF